MIAAVLLAAGNARRFGGSQKLLAPVPHDGGTIPLVRFTVICLLAAKLERIVVVVGREGESVRQCLTEFPVHIVANSEAESGMSSSLRVGVAEAARRWPESNAILIALGDQPIVEREIIEALVTALSSKDDNGCAPAIVAPRFQGVLGTPVLFTPPLLPELLALHGDRGARSVVERDTSRVRFVDFDRPAPLDVDTAADLTNLTSELRSSR